MSATLATAPPPGAGWAFELKWDGIRALAYLDGERVRLFTRTGNDVTHRYPELGGLGKALSPRNAVLDGEIVALDDGGRPSFELLQQRMHVENASTIRRLAQEIPVIYMAFDLLWLDGNSVLERSYDERREQLLALELSACVVASPAARSGRRFGDARDQSEVRSRGRRRQATRQSVRTRSPHAYLAEAQEHDRTGIRRRWMDARRTWSYRHGRLAAHRLLRRPRGAHTAVRGSRRQRATRHATSNFSTGSSPNIARDTSPFAAGTPPKTARFLDPVLVVAGEVQGVDEQRRRPSAGVHGLPRRHRSCIRRTGSARVTKPRLRRGIEAQQAAPVTDSSPLSSTVTQASCPPTATNTLPSSSFPSPSVSSMPEMVGDPGTCSAAFWSTVTLRTV